MRFAFAAVAALCAALVSAQNNAISIPAGAATLDVTAGQPLTIQWTDPSSGTVTIKLQQDPIVPDGGVTLATAIPASDGTATLQIPPPADVNSHVYTIEIIDDTDPTNINFSPNFGISGATGTAVGTASTGSATSSSPATSSGTSSGTSTTDTSTITSTDSSSSTATNSSSSGTDSSASTTNSQESTSSTSSAEPSETTSAPNSSGNGAGSLKVQGGLLAAAVGLIAVM